MRDISKLIKFLDTFITWFEKPPFRWNDKAKATLMEIKELLEQHDNVYSDYVTLKNSLIKHTCSKCGIHSHVPVHQAHPDEEF